MIQLEYIQKLIRLSVISPLVLHEKSVSVLLSAPPEHGKTEQLRQFSKIKGVHFATNFDGGIFEEIAKQIEIDEIRTIIIPDFLRVILRKYSTTANCIGILNALTEEGWYGKLPRGGLIMKPLRCNLITAITQDVLMAKRRRKTWESYGFTSRMLPVTFSYLPSTEKEIIEYIKKRMHSKDINEKFSKSKPIKVELPYKHATDLENIMINLKEEIEKQINITGFRLQRQLQVLAMANAIDRGNRVVDSTDIETIQKCSKFINFNFTKI